MAELKIHSRTIDLDKVPELSEDHYQGLLWYARQWDEAAQADWVYAIQQARGEQPQAEEVTPEPDPEPDPEPEGDDEPVGEPVELDGPPEPGRKPKRKTK